MTRRWKLFLVLAWTALLGSAASAHETQPGSLDIRQLALDRYEVVWKAPFYYGHPHPAQLVLPPDWQVLGQKTERRLYDAIVHRQVVTTGGRSLESSRIRFPGLEGTITDIFVRVTRLDGTTFTAIVRPTQPQVELRGERSLGTTAGEFIGLGFHHIMLGVDHLLFVLGLLLIVHGRMKLLKTITAFTVAHSLTLAVATLGYARAPLPPLNAAIALSILFLGPEIVRGWRGETTLTSRYPWVVAFSFGLLHGFGFATGLTTAGMPRAEIPLALLFFNVGVEIGQVVFVGLALAMARAFRTLEMRWPVWVACAPGYAVGVCGAYWTIQRTIMMFAGR
ncbi:MAG: HupE/UreJ family protein [Candidatus Krumholzibacteria bacterium]|nr:HupE/UreJ family protein [Candidatus Krumholzibacteria bacterium]MDH5271324.1 HupE/UreJ family protein [Candidatus Krumholzibacteria bacterium]MDH5626870.1 HupE/UreJ family protein [Candidatus Krumholzibacteria bacterium]